MPCFHVFHSPCIQQWFSHTQLRRECPLCKGKSQEFELTSIKSDLSERLQRKIESHSESDEHDTSHVSVYIRSKQLSLEYERLKAEVEAQHGLLEHLHTENSKVDSTLKRLQNRYENFKLQLGIDVAKDSADRNKEREAFVNYTKLKSKYKLLACKMNACRAINAFDQNSANIDLMSLIQLDVADLQAIESFNSLDSEKNEWKFDDQKDLRALIQCYAMDALAQHLKYLIEKQSVSSAKAVELTRLKSIEARAKEKLRTIAVALSSISSDCNGRKISDSQRQWLMTLAMKRRERMDQMRAAAVAAGMESELNLYLSNNSKRSTKRRAQMTSLFDEVENNLPKKKHSNNDQQEDDLMLNRASPKKIPEPNQSNFVNDGGSVNKNKSTLIQTMLSLQSADSDDEVQILSLVEIDNHKLAT